MTMQSGAYEDISRAPKGKNLVLAYALWFFFGTLGAHRFYVGHMLKGVLFLVGTIIAIALSAGVLPVVWVLAAVAWGIVLIFWIIDAFKLPRLVEATGKEVAPKVND
ncbi:TM2 domain-containing protein [Demequina sp.]|uniref:TM2 domain-containing protein n=1 Tax=Demequina sp. TaxID=2050685 RepID=UPI003D0D6C4C